MKSARLPVVLVVIDGWGLAPPGRGNAIEASQPASMRRLAREFPSTRLEASGEAVGLPAGQMGNSEVGHLSIGAGRIVDQDFVRVNKAVRAKTLGQQPTLRRLLQGVVARNSALHVMGLLGPGGVHSHEEHLWGVLESAGEAGATKVFVHHFLDGRDTPPKSALEYAQNTQAQIRRIGVGRVASVAGRYWAMDRDKRWDRTQRAYQMLTRLEGHRLTSAEEAIRAAYSRNETDEFVAPTVLEGAEPVGPGDAVLVYNFRPDRVRQLVRALADPAFAEFPTQRLGLHIAGMTLYDKTFDALGVGVVFPPDHPDATWGQHLANLGLKQLRVAETEKYAHVTYFFSGGREAALEGEDRLLVPSAKVATYDLKPAMSAAEITDALLDRLASTRYDLVVVNFANPDMVGHTGRLEPTIEACRVTDACVGRIAEFCQAHGYILAVTADHGNAEEMMDATGGPRTAHTTNPVPLIVAHASVRGRRLREGGLSSVAPTILEAAGLPRPREMTAPSLWGPLK